MWSIIEKCARHRGEVTHALAVARTGLSSTAARRDRRTRATFHALVAMNLAMRSEPAQARRSLSRAFDALDGVTNHEPAGRWSFADHSFLAAAGSSMAPRLRLLQEAEHYGQHAIEATRTSQKRNYALRQLSLANIYVQKRDLDAACTHAAFVLEAAQQIQSRRLVHRLHRLRSALVQWQDVSVVHDWIAQYDDAAANGQRRVA